MLVIYLVIINVYPINWFPCQEFCFLFPCDLGGTDLIPVSLRSSDITTHLPLNMIPSITAISSPNVQYVQIFCNIWSLSSCQHLMMYPFSCCRSSSCDVACCNWCIVMHSGVFVVVCMTSIFNCMPGISASLFSAWSCLESQSVMNRSGPDLYMILTLYLCILTRIHCILCDNVATSLLKIATSGLWFITIFTSLAKK